MSAVLPWQQSQWDKLLSRIAQDNLPHALLLTGRRGVGKQRLALQLAALLLCTEDQPEPCGQCKGCRLIAAGTHPDLKVIQPLEDKSVISVDQIRELSHYLSLTALCGGYQVVLISPADAMNVNAANSLLKTLEEPPANTLLLLMSERPSALTATIRSRCQVINFGKPAQDSALAWLKNQQPELDANSASTALELADGAPLRAAEMVAQGALNQRTEMLDDLEQIVAGRCDPIEIAKKWLKLGKKESLYWVYGWLVDMVRMKVANQPPYIANSDIAPRLSKIAARIELPLLYKRLDQVSEALRLADNPSLNAELLLEGVLIGWTPRR
ncbi:DNA polymerase III delta prime subunit [hydrothermal vent metagenome]|uniref:DNA polymerase III subunit delta' n=1 Tax=hydrothermal vent metagenome TaxID=652676 RepID=A0A3B0ZWB5_9ZZZZ